VASATSFSNQRSKSVGVSDHGRLLDGTTHVVVSVAQLVGEGLDLVRRSGDAVIDHGVPGGSGHALAGSNRHKVELVDVLVNDCGVDDGTWHWVLEASWLASEDPGVDPLGGVDVHQLGGPQTESREGLFDLVDLSPANSLDLAFTNSVSVEDDLSWVGAVGSLEGFTGIGHTSAERVGSFLSNIVLDDTGRPVGGGRVVHGATECKDGPLSKIGGVEHVQSTNHGRFVHERQVIDGPRNSSQLRIHLDENF